MGKRKEFWNNDAGGLSETVSSVMETVGHLCENSYLLISCIQTGESWCTEETRRFFGLEAQRGKNLEERLAERVHPYDHQEYLDGLHVRMYGTPDRELNVRILMASGGYAMFSIHSECFENDGETYFVMVLKNENILPEIDAVTDLYSHARYVSELSRRIRAHGRVALLQIEVSGFATFSLVYGVEFANRLLREVALQFIYNMDEHKFVYRLSGEQFAFILEESGREELVAFEHRIRSILAEGIQLEGKQIPLSIGSGALLIENRDEDAATARAQVAYALEHSLHKYQGKLVISNDEAQVSHGSDLGLMRRIHQSVRNGCSGFYVEYQPIVDSATGNACGAEALVRWHGEPYGTVAPGMFIDWMETDPSMYELGNYVLQTALTETLPLLENWPDFFVNVNISARQLERPEFREKVRDVLEETGFPARNLCLELTERCKDFPLDVLVEDVEYFKSLGLRVAMDDYGTGSASGTIGMNVPMDEIKIDMSFTQGIMDNPKHQAMVQSILYFARHAGMETCIEGVESKELQDYLHTYQATWFQGYYYAKPLPIAELRRFLEQKSAEKSGRRNHPLKTTKFHCV